ncbi:MAG TPA: hypothetical protein DET40_22560 [Lentisphaeria bacterium]|nr:MAG: hypothetical protein A2X45_17290 [Lentisphaerae bacterium GWF2_50_93]HCE46338.1 hypothetical protein [Lentisphaeria bacterium]
MKTSEKPKYTFHFLGNAHLDPVWLWDWREGLNEGIITCRTILDLMDEDPELTFNRGESVIYEHIEQTDPETFSRIKKYVKEGRWDVVGGTFLQSDENLPETETLVRQYMRGQQYFKSRFGKNITVGWAADCFGHAAGMPDIMASAGIKYFAFTRPEKQQLPLSKSAFRWIGAGGSEILAYRPTGWYGTNRDEMNRRLDETIASSEASDLVNVGIFYGLGNHGGGPTRRAICEIRKWGEQHPEVKIVFSTYHKFFTELDKEVKAKAPNFLPKVVGEMGYSQRGCYSSVAKFKFQYRRAQANIFSAEKTSSAISAKLGKPLSIPQRTWDTVLFNGFHDILPGSSIERATDEQIESIGSAVQDAKYAQFTALNALSNQIDTRVVKATGDMPTGVSMLVWNPHPYPYEGYMEMEACLDWRPIFEYRNRQEEIPVRILGSDKKPLPFQLVATDCPNLFTDVGWRKHAVIPVKLPAMGWSMMEMAWVEGAPAPKGPKSKPATATANSIQNSIFKVEATAGKKGIKILKNGKPFLKGDGLSAVMFEDDYGSWGGGENDPDAVNITKVKEQWTVKGVKVLEKGPWRSSIWVRLAGGKSRIDLTIKLYAGLDTVEISARVLWDNPRCRLKLVMPVDGEKAEYEVPGGSIKRPPLGEVPGCRWVRVNGGNGQSVAFISDAIGNFNLKPGALEATVVRSSAYSHSGKIKPGEPWFPASDCGELKFNFILASGSNDLAKLAENLEQQIVTLPVPAKRGTLPSEGSLMQIETAGVSVLAFKPASNGKGFVLRLLETAGKSVQPKLKLLGKTVQLGKIGPRKIASWRIDIGKSGIKASPCNTAENSI